jgi:hypothetical protein
MPTVLEPPASPTAVRSHVAGFAACRIGPEELTRLRQQPGPFQGPPLPATFLKHSDEQTVAGLAAVSRAMHGHGLAAVDYRNWGVVAAPRFFARAKLAVVLPRFAVEGAWAISPQLIPHRSQHALSGTISQALKIHGPNFGVGGGPDSAGEGLLVAGGMLADDQLPGVWVVLTGFDPEWVPSAQGVNNTDTPLPPTCDCLALALALLPVGQQSRGLFLSVGAAPAPGQDEDWPEFSLEGVVRHLAERGPAAAHWRLPCGAWATLEDCATAGGMCL